MPNPLRKYRDQWFSVTMNLVMIFVGMQFIDIAYHMQVDAPPTGKDFSLLSAMYLAFIAGLFPNYATSFAEALRGTHRKSLAEVGEVVLFFFLILVLNAAVIYAALWI
jgi:hypothetical protein